MAVEQDRIVKIIANQLQIDEGQVTPEASFMDDLGADSLDTVELIMALEEEFDIEIPDSDAEKIRTVQDAIEYMNTHSQGLVTFILTSCYSEPKVENLVR